MRHNPDCTIILVKVSFLHSECDTSALQNRCNVTGILAIRVGQNFSLYLDFYCTQYAASPHHLRYTFFVTALLHITTHTHRTLTPRLTQCLSCFLALYSPHRHATHAAPRSQFSYYAKARHHARYARILLPLLFLLRLHLLCSPDVMQLPCIVTVTSSVSCYNACKMHRA